MESVGVEGMPGQGSALNAAARQIDPAGAVAVGMLLGTFYLMGFADPQFARAAAGFGQGNRHGPVQSRA